MSTRVVLAVPQREYAAKLAEFLREEEPEWDIAVFTHGGALRREIHEGDEVRLLIGVPELLREADIPEERHGSVIALVDTNGPRIIGEWQEVDQYQPLPALLSCIRKRISMSIPSPMKGGGPTQVVTIFSASGGAGKTTVALNAIRHFGERGLRTFYLNLEALNATSLLFGRGEPDSLSRLLYAMQTQPEQWENALEQLCRHQPQLRTDYLDAPEHPGERLALTSEVLTLLLDKMRSTGKYDLIVIDPDTGAGEWHRELLMLSDRAIWLVLDDTQSLLKAEKLLRYWQSHGDVWGKCNFIWNKASGGSMLNRWNLPVSPLSASLPYIAQWKAVDQPGKSIASPVFSGAIEMMLQAIGLGIAGSAHRMETGGRRIREEGNGSQRSHVRGAG